MAELQGSGPLGLDALAMPACNAALRATGREDQIRALSLTQRLAGIFA